MGTPNLQRAAEVLRNYAAMIEESEVHHSGPLKGRCTPEIEKEVAEYRSLADALIAPSESAASVAQSELAKNVSIDGDIATVYGVKITGALLRTFGEPTPDGRWFRIVKLEDGVATVQSILITTPPPEAESGRTLTQRQKNAIREAIGFRLSGETDDVDREALERALEVL